MTIFAISLELTTLSTIKIEQKLDLKFDFLLINVMLSKRVYSFIRYLRVNTVIPRLEVDLLYKSNSIISLRKSEYEIIQGDLLNKSMEVH